MHHTNLLRHLLQARWTFTLGSRPCRPSPRPCRPSHPTCRASRVRRALASPATRASPTARLEVRMARMVTDQRRQRGLHQSAIAKVKHEATQATQKAKLAQDKSAKLVQRARRKAATHVQRAALQRAHATTRCWQLHKTNNTVLFSNIRRLPLVPAPL